MLFHRDIEKLANKYYKWLAFKLKANKVIFSTTVATGIQFFCHCHQGKLFVALLNSV